MKVIDYIYEQSAPALRLPKQVDLLPDAVPAHRIRVYLPISELMAVLTDKQQRFCEEYLIDLNATQAAIRAGYSKKSARVDASRMLTNANIENYIQELKQVRSERTKITSDMVLQELGKIGFSNVQDYLEGDLSIKDLVSIERNKADAVSSIKKSVTEFEGGSKTVVEFKLHDKLKALEMIGRHIGFFEKDNEQNKAPMIIPEIRVYTGEWFSGNAGCGGWSCR